MNASTMFQLQRFFLIPGDLVGSGCSCCLIPSDKTVLRTVLDFPEAC